MTGVSEAQGAEPGPWLPESLGLQVYKYYLLWGLKYVDICPTLGHLEPQDYGLLWVPKYMNMAYFGLFGGPGLVSEDPELLRFWNSRALEIWTSGAL